MKSSLFHKSLWLDIALKALLVTREKQGHFQVAQNLAMKLRLSAKLFIRKLVLFAYK